MLGWYDVDALAAVVLGSSAFFILFILGSGFALAVMPMVAVAMGRGDEVQVRRDTRMGLWLSMLFALTVMPAFWWSGPILLALGQDPLISDLAQDYLRIAGVGLLPALLVMALKSYPVGTGTRGHRALGDAGGRRAECRPELGLDLRQLGRARTGRAGRCDRHAVHRRS